MVEMKPPKYASTNVHSIGFEGDVRGKLYVQFKNTAGELTTRGYYQDVPRQVYNALGWDRAPSKFIHQNVKEFFTWTALGATEDAPVTPEEFSAPAFEEWAPVKPQFFVVFIPVDTPNTVEAIAACIKAQRED